MVIEYQDGVIRNSTTHKEYYVPKAGGPIMQVLKDDGGDELELRWTGYGAVNCKGKWKRADLLKVVAQP